MFHSYMWHTHTCTHCSCHCLLHRTEIIEDNMFVLAYSHKSILILGKLEKSDVPLYNIFLIFPLKWYPLFEFFISFSPYFFFFLIPYSKTSYSNSWENIKDIPTFGGHVNTFGTFFLNVSPGSYYSFLDFQISVPDSPKFIAPRVASSFNSLTKFLVTSTEQVAFIFWLQILFIISFALRNHSWHWLSILFFSPLRLSCSSTWITPRRCWKEGIPKWNAWSDFRK